MLLFVSSIVSFLVVYFIDQIERISFYLLKLAIGTKAFQLGPSLGSKINPVSAIGNAIINKGVDIASHKLMGLFDPTNNIEIETVYSYGYGHGYGI